MPLPTDEDADPWTAGETITCDIPAGALEYPEACRGKRSDAAHLRSGHEPDRSIVRQAEKVGHPFAHDLLDDHADGPPTYRPAF